MSRVRSFGRFVLALLREIGDESAYQRHLAAHGREHSGSDREAPRPATCHSSKSTSRVGRNASGTVVGDPPVLQAVGDPLLALFGGADVAVPVMALSWLGFSLENFEASVSPLGSVPTQ